MSADRTDKNHTDTTARAGMPGDGAGRRDEIEPTGVHPASAGWPEQDMPIRTEAEWGQGERGAAGYEDSGESEIIPPKVSGDADAGIESDVTALTDNLRGDSEPYRRSPADASEEAGTGTDR